MLTPNDKLTAGGNDIIQIVVTTSCDIFTCSNCTQLLPFRHDYKHMTLGCFERAVKSLVDWPGVVALFGGNPCSHPEFPELCNILEKHIHPQSRRGLWSNALLGHGAQVRRTFYPDGRFNLNVHRNVEAAIEIGEWLPGKLIKSSVRDDSHHGPILVAHRDLNIQPEAWEAMRENCDINQKWSAAIVEDNGKPMAYFCEVAAALDGVRGDHHGVPVKAGWWKLPIIHFQHQVQGCCDQGCGVPLKLEGHLDSQRTYDVTQSFVPYTSLKKLHVHIVPVNDHAFVGDTTDYLRLRS